MWEKEKMLLPFPEQISVSESHLRCCLQMFSISKIGKDFLTPTKSNSKSCNLKKKWNWSNGWLIKSQGLRSVRFVWFEEFLPLGLIFSLKVRGNELQCWLISLLWLLLSSVFQQSNQGTLTHSHTMTPYDGSWKEAFRKHCGKRRNCLYMQFLLFPQCFLL